jgi:hypothetical protein
MSDERANDSVSDFMIAVAGWYGSTRKIHSDGDEEHTAIPDILYPKKVCSTSKSLPRARMQLGVSLLVR